MKRTTTAAWIENRGIWRIHVQKDGVRKSFYSSKPGRAGQREANAKADAWLEEDFTGTDRVTVAQAWQLYIEYRRGLSGTSDAKKEEYFARCYILPALGKKKIHTVTEMQLQKLINDAYTKGGLKSKKTLTELRGKIYLFMRFCRKSKLTAIVVEDLEIPKIAKTKQKHILQPDGLKKLFACSDTMMRGNAVFDNYVYAYRFEVLTGLRPGELVGLKWSDISGRDVSIKRAVNTLGEITTGKNENAIRHFVLNDYAYETLMQQSAISTSESVFEIESQSTYRHRWERYCAYNGIEYVTLYELRHTFVSIAKTLPIGQVKSIVGHSANMDTFGVYGHEVNGDMERTADDLTAIFEDILQEK